MLTWRTAYGEAIRVFDRGGSAKKANAAFIELIDRGFAAVPRNGGFEMTIRGLWFALVLWSNSCTLGGDVIFSARAFTANEDVPRQSGRAI